MSLVTRGSKPTEEEIEKIAKMMRTKQFSGKQIAEALGRSRNSIMGLIWRTPMLKAIGLPNPAPFPKKAEPEKRPESQPVIVGPRTLLELGVFHCKFPLWAHDAKPGQDGLFCAQARLADSPYCEKHYKLCCTPAIRQVKTKQVA
jgi:hypothetical protein